MVINSLTMPCRALISFREDSILVVVLNYSFLILLTSYVRMPFDTKVYPIVVSVSYDKT